MNVSAAETSGHSGKAMYACAAETMPSRGNGSFLPNSNADSLYHNLEGHDNYNCAVMCLPSCDFSSPTLGKSVLGSEMSGYNRRLRLVGEYCNGPRGLYTHI